jgi:HAD superfamily hydrolase (TIGR01509 family)
MGGDKLMPAVAGIEEDTELGQQIATRRAEIFREIWIPRLQAFPSTRELVQRFAGDGFTLAVASSAKQDELRSLLDVAGVSDLIATRTSSDDAEESKPDPDIVQAALKRTGSAPEAAIMVGDTPYDVEAALRTGIRIVGLECGGWHRVDLHGAVEVYTDPADLLHRYETSVFAQLRDQASKGVALR